MGINDRFEGADTLHRLLALAGNDERVRPALLIAAAVMLVRFCVPCLL